MEIPNIKSKTVEKISFDDKNIINWDIKCGAKDGDIIATNSITFITFKGSVEDFNKKYLRGD